MNKRKILTVVATVVVVAAAVAGGQAVFGSDDEPEAGAVVTIEATEGACWTAVLPTSTSGPDQSAEETGCGPSILALGNTGGTVSVTKTTQEGTVTAIAFFDDKEIGRQSTADPFGSVTITALKAEG